MDTGPDMTTLLQQQLDQAQLELNQFLAQPVVDHPITKFSLEHNQLLDQLCDLYQRFDELSREDQTERTVATQARLKAEAENRPVLTRIRTPQGDFDDIESAALAMNIKPSSLRVYLTNNPRHYMRIE